MYNKGYVLLGIALIILIFVFPTAYNIANGAKTEITLAKARGECIRNVEWMKANHMILLKQWRYERIREGKLYYTSPDTGKTYIMSFDTCFKCHTNKADFCDKCHEYSGVNKPYCFSCHVFPESIKSKE